MGRLFPKGGGVTSLDSKVFEITGINEEISEPSLN
jgi:hypothetical protein